MHEYDWDVDFMGVIFDDRGQGRGEQRAHGVCFPYPLPRIVPRLDRSQQHRAPTLPPVVVHDSGQGAIFVLATTMTILLSPAAPLPPNQCAPSPV